LILERTDLPKHEEALLASEWHFAVELSKQLGVPGVRRMLAQMSSRDFTDYRAAALIEIAQAEISAAYMEERAKKGRRRR
jgi:NCAIR mutase (PurE)-related protein